ncbi:prolactin regulatory element-binding protein isoform X1 [Hyalella azteca]|uniref:Prolactin regulatory element-binding protein isoform X1 n=1 Tax=Hyalella azteca TaxID=294128 RepID=A0A8B7NW79_HYAAZ|nr:prolactin regulatory element-binding protein isoform X1 [Hyalella azteca]
MAPPCTLELVSKTECPPYALTCVGDRYVIVGGGGGFAKTGIKNKFVVYQLYHMGKQTTARCVLSHDVGDYCISNMTAWVDEERTAKVTDNRTNEKNHGYTTPCPTINLAYGCEESCVIVQLTPKLVTENNAKDQITSAQQGADAGVRNRKPQADKSTSRSSSENNKASKNGIVRLPTYYTFTVMELCRFTSVFSRPPSSTSPGLVAAPGVLLKEDVYQKTCRVTRDCSKLVTGGTDGRVRVWSCLQRPPKLLLDIDAHLKEVDQLDVSPDGSHVVSVCKGQRECCVWSCSSGKKVAALGLDTAGLKYKFAWARFGCVENNIKNTRLFTISNPVVGTKHPGIVCKWSDKQYALERRQSLDGVLSNLAVSSDGRYLATGTMDGDLIIMIAFSLQVLQRLPDAHSMFVTGLEWLPDGSRTSCIVRGFSDASVLSVSCDNAMKIAHVPSVTMAPVWLVAILSAVVLCATFVIASYLGL